jgi:hypothetical protein
VSHVLTLISTVTLHTSLERRTPHARLFSMLSSRPSGSSIVVLVYSHTGVRSPRVRHFKARRRLCKYRPYHVCHTFYVIRVILLLVFLKTVRTVYVQYFILGEPLNFSYSS